MEIKDYIAETLVQIAEGIKEAQNRLKDEDVVGRSWDGTVIRSERMDKSKKRYSYICQGRRESCQWGQVSGKLRFMIHGE